MKILAWSVLPLLALLVMSKGISAAPLVNTNRLAISCDGNYHDEDDIGASAWAVALLACAGKQSKLVYFGYADHIWETDAGQEADMKASVEETMKKYGGFDLTVVYDAKQNTTAAVNALAAEIDKSTAANPLTIIEAGPCEVIGRAVEKSNTSARQYVTLVSHNLNAFNDNHAKTDHGSKYTFEYIDNLGVVGKHIRNQNGGRDQYPAFGGNGSDIAWMENHTDTKIQWLWDRNFIARGRSLWDVSDCGMTWFYLFDDEYGNITKLRPILENYNRPTALLVQSTAHSLPSVMKHIGLSALKGSLNTNSVNIAGKRQSTHGVAAAGVRIIKNGSCQLVP